MYEAQLTQKWLSNQAAFQLSVGQCDEFAEEIFRVHAKFQMYWILIEMTGLRHEKRVNVTVITIGILRMGKQSGRCYTIFPHFTCMHFMQLFNIFFLMRTSFRQGRKYVFKVHQISFIKKNNRNVDPHDITTYKNHRSWPTSPGARP